MSPRYCKKFVGIEVGDSFSSYEDLKDRIILVQEHSQIPLLLRDCVTLNGAVKKRPNIAIRANPALEYHSLHYTCVCGRKDANRTQTYIRLGISPEYLSDDKEKCGAEIKFGLSKDCQLLEVKRIVDVHNHKISQKLYRIVSLSKFTAMTTAEDYTSPRFESRSPVQENQYRYVKHETSEISECDIDSNMDYYHNKRKLEDEENFDTNAKRIKLTDADKEEKNCQKKKVKGRRIAFRHLLEKMYSIKGANCEVYEVGMKPFALFFQTEEMEKNFAAYPEVLIIDSSYSISALRMKLHVLMNADGNGHCTVVGFFFAMEENSNVISFLIDTFINFNPECCQTRSIMLDHTLYSTHLKAVMSHFSSATSFMCSHFTVRAYERKVIESPNIVFSSNYEREECKELFKNMTLAKDEKSYYEYYHRFKLYSPPILINYFILNWQRRKNEWVDCLKDSNSWFLDQRHCGIETIERTVTDVCRNYSSVQTLLSDLLTRMTSLQLQRKQKALDVPIKGPIIAPPFRMAEIQYKQFLTPYAYSLVRQQMQSSLEVKILDNNDVDQCTIISPKYGKLHSTPVSCPCMVFTVIGLPCCHIFAMRNEKGMHAFQKSLCKPRWSLQHLRKSLNLNFEDAGLVQDVDFGPSVLPEYEETNQDINRETQGDMNSLKKRDTAEVPFVPLSTLPPVDTDETSEKNFIGDECLEEIVIDEVDPDGDVNLISGLEGSSAFAAGGIDWADMLETL